MDYLTHYSSMTSAMKLPVDLHRLFPDEAVHSQVIVLEFVSSILECKIRNGELNSRSSDIPKYHPCILFRKILEDSL